MFQIGIAIGELYLKNAIFQHFNIQFLRCLYFKCDGDFTMASLQTEQTEPRRQNIHVHTKRPN